MIGTAFVIMPISYYLYGWHIPFYGSTMRSPFSGTVSNATPSASIELSWFWDELVAIYDFRTNNSDVMLRLYDYHQDPEGTNRTILYNGTSSVEPLYFEFQARGLIIVEVWMNTSSAYFTTWIKYDLPPPPIPPGRVLILPLSSSITFVIFGLVLTGFGLDYFRKGVKLIVRKTSPDTQKSRKVISAPGIRLYTQATSCFAVALLFLGITGPMLMGMSASAYIEVSEFDWGPFTVTLSESHPSTNITITNLGYDILTLQQCYTNSGFVWVRMYSVDSTTENPLLLEALVNQQHTYEVLVAGYVTIDISRYDSDVLFTCWIYSSAITVHNPFLDANLPWVILIAILGMVLLILGMSVSWQGTKQLEKWQNTYD
jgi:hypothetical protein